MHRTFKSLRVLSAVGLLLAATGLMAFAQEGTPPPGEGVYPEETVVLHGGTGYDAFTIEGPPTPPPGAVRPMVAIPPGINQLTGSALLPVPAFDWSFGCSATSASMIAAYYDRSGYPYAYTGPTNGGEMPMNNSSWPNWWDGSASRNQCPLSATRNGLDGRTRLGHVDDYWVAYGSTANDPYVTAGRDEHPLGHSLADFMKTNRKLSGNSDGSTTFYYATSGSPTTPALLEYWEVDDVDGGYGVKLFYESRGYTVNTMFNQYIEEQGHTYGFTYEQYKAEIDAGRPVMLHVQNHTMVGIGYNDSTSNLVYLNDTWDYYTHSMEWAGDYSGLSHYGVTVVRLAPAPSPAVTVDGADGGDWAGASPALQDPSGDASNDNQDVTDVYAAQDATYAYFRVDTVGSPEESEVHVYVDNVSGGCTQEAGHPEDEGASYDKRILAVYDAGIGGWSALLDACSGGNWVETGAPVMTAVADFLELGVPLADYGDAGGETFFVRYGAGTDFSPDRGDHPTAVTLASFTAAPALDGVRVSWETTSESDLLGFSLFRSEWPAGPPVPLNGEPIRSQSPGSSLGASYVYTDENVEHGGTYAYWLDILDVQGGIARSGPVIATASASAYRVFMPVVWLPAP